jgi:cytochrome c-type biogenesis protein CcmH
LTCQCSCGLTVHSCNHLQCGFAVPAKEQIAEQIGQEKSLDAILTSFVSRYGEKVLSAPTTSGFNLAAWITPFLVVLIGGVGIGLISLRWTKRRPQDQASAAPPDEPNPYRERLQKELDDFEG